MVKGSLLGWAAWVWGACQPRVCLSHWRLGLRQYCRKVAWGMAGGSFSGCSCVPGGVLFCRQGAGGGWGLLSAWA